MQEVTSGGTLGKGVDDLAQKDQVMRPTEKALETMKKILRSRFITTAHVMFGREVENLTEIEIYKTIAATAKQSISDNWIKTNRQYAERQEKQIYYFSIEFLLGRLLKSNLINLGIEEALKDVLKDFNLNLSDAYEVEPDAGLGNGGRLARSTPPARTRMYDPLSVRTFRAEDRRRQPG